MRKLLGVVVAASLLATGVAIAQDHPHGEGDHGARTETRQRAERPRPNRRPQARPSMGRRPAHHFRSQGRWRPSMHAPAFRYPPGFRYRRWVSGATLPRVFLAAPYFYGNFAALGLAPPPPGFRWVRYGPDLLLVNVRTGRIADVVDGVFF